MAKNDHKPARLDQKLTQMQQVFVRHLAADPRSNQTKAAIEAGYNAKTASAIASQLMNLPKYRHVQAAYQALVKERMAALEITDEKVMETLAAIAWGDRRKVQRVEGGKMVVADSADLHEEEALMVEGYKEVSLNDGTGATRIIPIFSDRTRAVQNIAKIRGLLKERVEAKVDVTIHDARQNLKSALARLANPGVSGPVDQQSEPGCPPGAGV